MNIYLDDKDLPKSCWACDRKYCNPADGVSCNYNDNAEIYCNFSEISTSSRHPNCWLKSIQEHDKKLTKEICDEIKEVCKLNIRTIKNPTEKELDKCKVYEAFNEAIFGVIDILNKIQAKYENKEEL